MRKWPKRSGSQGGSSAAAAEKKEPSRLLLSIAQLSQIGVFVLGTVGYFYTVRPIFQYQQLQEKSAQVEMEKRVAEEELKLLRAQQAQITSEIAVLQAKLKGEQTRSARFAGEAEMSRSREAAIAKRTEEVERSLRDNLSTLDRARWEFVLLDMLQAYLFGDWGSEKRDEAKKSGGFILAQEENWPQPASNLLSALERVAKVNRRGLPDSYFAEIRSTIKDIENKLQCDVPNFKALHEKFSAEMAAAAPQVEAEVERKMAEIIKEYADKGERLRISEEFRGQWRRSINFGKTFGIENRYGDDLRKMRRQCLDKGLGVLDALRAAKGAKG